MVTVIILRLQQIGLTSCKHGWTP